MMRLSSSVRLNLVGGARPGHRRRGRRAAGLLAGGRRLRRACRHQGVVLGLLASMALLGACLDDGARAGDLRQCHRQRPLLTCPPWPTTSTDPRLSSLLQ